MKNTLKYSFLFNILNFYKVKNILPLLLIMLLSSCATQQYLKERRICTTEGYNNYPKIIEIKQVIKRRPIAINQQINCTTINNNYIHNYRTTHTQTYNQCINSHNNNIQYEDYIGLEYVDINEAARNEFINRCTNNNCIILYGNKDCII